MSPQNDLDDFISNLLMSHDLSQYSFRVDVVPNVLDQWRQNFQYALGPTNPAFIDATLSPQDILVWGYTLQYNQNGVLWRVDPAGRPHPDDYNNFLEQNRVIQRATERTVAEIKPLLETSQVAQASSQSQPNPAESSAQNGDATISTQDTKSGSDPLEFRLAGIQSDGTPLFYATKDVTISVQGTGNDINQTLYNNNAVYKHEADLIAQINSIDTTKFNWDINNFKKIYEKNKATYAEISKKTGIPPELIAALHYRESGCDFTTYLHNGDPLGKPTTHVPKGKNFDNFTDAAIDALSEHSYLRDEYGLSAGSNDMVAMMAFAEFYNGDGYYKYHKDTVSPYVYSGTNVYQKGKYDWDSHYNPNLVDAQPGVYLLINSLKK